MYSNTTRKTVLFSIFFLCLIVVGTSCKKDDEDKTPDTRALITGGSWQLKALTVDPAIDWFGMPVNNLYAAFPACLKDDRTIFQVNGAVTFDEGPSRCEPEDPQTTSATWSLSPDRQTVTVTYPEGDVESWSIIELTNQLFIVDYTETIEGVTYTFSGTYVKQ